MKERLPHRLKRRLSKQLPRKLARQLRKLRRSPQPHLPISVIIPAYNEEKYLSACLQSLLEAKTENVIEVIVVDNASTDRTAEIAAGFPDVTVVREPRKGVQHARQCGFRTATGTVLAYSDADNRIPPKWLEKIAKEFYKNDELACLSGPYFYFDVPPWQEKTIRLFWKLLAFPTYRITKYMVVGGNFAARRAALEKIGGFDTSIAFYGDDTNLARKLATVGKVRFSPSFIMHTSGRRFRRRGMIRTGAVYMANFVSEAVLHRPLTKEYEDVR